MLKPDRTKKAQKSKKTNGFVLVPRRWVVERSFAWMGRFRRLVRDYERLGWRCSATSGTCTGRWPDGLIRAGNCHPMDPDVYAPHPPEPRKQPRNRAALCPTGYTASVPAAPDQWDARGWSTEWNFA